MALLYLYSANPWYAHEISMKYLSGKHFVWCSDYYDPSSASSISSTALTAPSSSPKGIYSQLKCDCDHEDSHSNLIKGYRKTFKRLATSLFASGSIDIDQKNDILATINSGSWRIWRPTLYIIHRQLIESTGRLVTVPVARRAAYGNEWQISDLLPTEFEIIER